MVVALGVAAPFAVVPFVVAFFADFAGVVAVAPFADSANVVVPGDLAERYFLVLPVCHFLLFDFYPDCPHLAGCPPAYC